MKTIHAIVAALTMAFAIAPIGAANRPIHLAHSPNLSPDGQTLLFSHAGDIWSVSIDGGLAQRLTLNPARDTTPYFSPDGKRIAFVSGRTGHRQVHTMPAEGGAPQPATFHTEGAALRGWTPDGQNVLIHAARDHGWRYAERFFTVDLNQRAAEKLLFDSEGREGSLSPDGKKLLFVREGEREWRKGYHGARAAQIWLYDLRKKSFIQLLKLDTGCRSPIWKPDATGFYYAGSQGAANGARNLWAYDFDSKKSTQLTHFDDDLVTEPAVSADGKTIVFRHLFDLYRLQPGESTQPQRIDIQQNGDPLDDDTLRRTLNNTNSVAFTHDGLEIAMTVGGDLYVMDTELREPKPVTQSAAFESSPVFSKNADALYYVGQSEGQVDIYRAQPADPKKFWWQNDSFKTEKLTNDAAAESNLRLSPTGDTLAYVRKRGDLWLMDLTEKDAKPQRIFTGFDQPDYDFSPDGRWIVYAHADDDFNNEIWIIPTDGSAEPVNISRHPDDESDPVWSPDGKLIAFTGNRSHEQVDIFYVWLSKEDDDQTSRQRKLDKAIELIQKARKKPTTPAKPNAKNGDPAKDKTTENKKVDESKEESTKSDKDKGDAKRDDKSEAKTPPIHIDFDNIHRRIRSVSLRGTIERNLLWSPDSKRLAFRSDLNGKNATYTVSIPDDLKPKTLTTTTGSQARWLKDRIVWIVNGVPQTIKVSGSGAAGSATTHTFSVEQELSKSQRHTAAFDDAWRTMRDHWYDSNFGNHNWDAVRRKYRPQATAAHDVNTLTEIIYLMLGELNGSHLGFYPRSSGANGNGDDWKPTTAHLGLRFDPKHRGPGLLVRDVLPTGPTDDQLTRVKPGETLLAINGQTVDPQYDLTQILNGSLQRDIQLQIRNADGEERDMTIRPIRHSSARGLVYKHWLESNRRTVDQRSKNRLGYLHISAMDWNSFLEFERELYDVGYGKEGLVIDVRNNGGGFTSDHLLTALTQPKHAITVPRGGGVGYPQSRKVYATWDKPIVVLCNQNSYSNAEIFSHAIKNLKRGKLIGVPTAGGVISTGAVSIMDVGTLRWPFRGWFVAKTGQDMELNGAVPDIILWPKPEHYAKNLDTQLNKAVQVLIRQVDNAKKNPAPKPVKATDRKTD
jgi:tricorn protease